MDDRQLLARTDGILVEVEEERADQIRKWGEQHHSPHQWLAILTEEVGEVAKDVAEMRIDEFDFVNYRKELIQVAAVAVAAIEALDISRA
jgi:NTP pyrophosphatase (non-canonical NTP hydrolase)